ncbi:MAG TPA: DUF2299 family protein [Candidatus Sulfotelmatobacter sp.]
MDWLVQSLTSRVVWEVILLIGGGSILGIVKAKWPRLAPYFLYGFAGATCVAIILFTLTGHAILSKSQPETTTENIEENIRKWADEAGIGVTKVPAQDSYFGYVLRLNSGNPVSVYRPRQAPGFLQIQAGLALAPEHMAMLNKLSKPQADEAIEEITMELNRDRIGYVMQTSGAPPGLTSPTTTSPSIFQQTILLTASIVISKDFTESAFLARMNEMDSEIGIVRGITDLTLKRYSRANPHVMQQ